MKIGIIGGNGTLPLALIKRLGSANCVLAALKGNCSRETFKYAATKAWFGVGELQAIVSYFHENNVMDVVFLGGINRISLLFYFRPDGLAKEILSSASAISDDAILRAIANKFSDHKLNVVSPYKYLSEYLEPLVYEAEILTKDELFDVNLGIKVAREIGRLDIGQSVVAAKGTIVAVEGVEGTDNLIIRSKKLTGPGSIVVKICKPGQDQRFDLPTVGPKTFKNLAYLKARAIVLDAGKTVVIDRDECLRLAKRHGIAVISMGLL